VVILNKTIEVIILSGAISGERDVSIRSGQRVYSLIRKYYPARLIVLDDNELPGNLDPRSTLIFPIIHGDFGEDGRLQRLMEIGGFVYVGSDASSMELTVDKALTKNCVAEGCIPVLPHVTFCAQKCNMPSFNDLCQRIGSLELFIKPNDKGSSIQCFQCHTAERFADFTESVCEGTWIVESLCPGRDLTVGVLIGRALSVVEICHNAEFLDYDSKYIPGRSQHIAPAPIGADLTSQIMDFAELAFARCKCRDWARVDFLLRNDEKLFFLELNSIPGFTDVSLYPDSAIGCGISPGDCLCALVNEAMKRHRQRFL
jgi:D-alanine-D-alanine ligase